MKTYQIRRKSRIGQQIETAYDKENQKWVKEIAYAEPNFQATPEEAKKLLAELKDGFRGKWIRLYIVDGA